jgi:hypothetical protein
VQSRQLLAFRFPPGSRFEGQLIGALERIESGGTMRILDALFVGRDADSGEVVAVAMSSTGAAGMIGSLLSFRLDDRARQAATAHALESPAGATVRSVTETLAAGEAIASVLVEHTWAVMLRETIERLGGIELLSESGDATEVENAWDRLRAGSADG